MTQEVERRQFQPRESRKLNVDLRKMSTLCSTLLDVEVGEYGKRIERLSRIISTTTRVAGGGGGGGGGDGGGGGGGDEHPLLRRSAVSLQCELAKVALCEARDVQSANVMTHTAAYKARCASVTLDSFIAFPPQMHADAARRGCKLGYRLYHNEFLGMLHAERGDVTESKAINRLVLTCLTASASATGLERRMRESLRTRTQLQMDRVPCEHFAHCVMAQTGYALDNFLDALPDADTRLAERPEDVCYLRFMAHTMFDEESRQQVCAMYNTRHATTEDNVADMRKFISSRVVHIGMRRLSAVLAAPDSTRSLYAGLLGSIAANALIAAYVLRCETAAPSKVATYTRLLQDDYERARLCIDTAALPLCVDTLGPGASIDKRLLILNMYHRLRAEENVEAGDAAEEPGGRRCRRRHHHHHRDHREDAPTPGDKAKGGKHGGGFGSNFTLAPHTIKVVNNVITSIHARHNEIEGASDRPVREGSEFAFNHFNDMSTYAVREVVMDLVKRLEAE